MDDTTRKIMHSRGQCISQIVNGIDGRVEKYGELFGDDIRRLVDVSIEPYKDIFSDDDVYQVENYVDSYIVSVLQGRRNVPVYRYTPLTRDKKATSNDPAISVNPGPNAGHTVANKFPVITDVISSNQRLYKVFQKDYNQKIKNIIKEI